MEAIKRMNVEENDFKQLFRQISSKEISDNMFTLVMDNFYVITAGNEAHYNSMIGSGGGFGLLFRKPASWCVIRTDRYTLELIQKEQTYTIAYFSDRYKEQLIFLGSNRGGIAGKWRKWTDRYSNSLRKYVFQRGPAYFLSAN